MEDDVIIVGAGIGGLTLGLALHQAGIPCRIFESTSEIKQVGVGINLLPHATRELAALGVTDVGENRQQDAGPKAAETRDLAIARLTAALRAFPVLGVRTNIQFLLRLLDHPRFRSGTIDTSFLDRQGASLAAAPDERGPGSISGCLPADADGLINLRIDSGGWSALIARRETHSHEIHCCRLAHPISFVTDHRMS